MKQVFVSYSWDSILHKSKVKAIICDRLRSDGVDVVADCYLDKLDLGEDITKFMQNGIAGADRVIVVLTPGYIKKLENGKGGVANEELIISNEIMGNVNTKKFIPVYMDYPSFEDMPLSMKRRNGISYNTESDIAENYPKLLASIMGEPNQIEVDSKDSPYLKKLHYTPSSKYEVLISLWNKLPKFECIDMWDIKERGRDYENFSGVIGPRNNFSSDGKHSPLYLLAVGSSNREIIEKLYSAYDIPKKYVKATKMLAIYNKGHPFTMTDDVEKYLIDKYSTHEENYKILIGQIDLTIGDMGECNKLYPIGTHTLEIDNEGLSALDEFGLKKMCSPNTIDYFELNSPHASPYNGDKFSNEDSTDVRFRNRVKTVVENAQRNGLPLELNIVCMNGRIDPVESWDRYRVHSATTNFEIRSAFIEHITGRIESILKPNYKTDFDEEYALEILKDAIDNGCNGKKNYIIVARSQMATNNMMTKKIFHIDQMERDELIKPNPRDESKHGQQGYFVEAKGVIAVNKWQYP